MHHRVGRRPGGGARRAARALIVAGAAAAAVLAELLAGPGGAATARAATAQAAGTAVAGTAAAAAGTTAAGTAAAGTTTLVASTPPMGFNTWYRYHGGNEPVVLAQARALVSTGLAAAGYGYVNLDDGWMAATRTTAGALRWNTALYPHGLPWLAAQIHALGLKFGIYEAIGNQTCQHYPGSWAHYQQDASTFAQWGVDFVKIDECGGLPTWITQATLTRQFQQYGTALRAANPGVVYSQELPIAAMPRTPGTLTAAFLDTVKSSSQSANMWRVAADEKYTQPAAYTIFGHLDADLHLYGFAGPGHWNDLDMLLPGVPAFHWNLTQELSQIGVWAMEASPLIISTDVRALTAAELAALKNPIMINIDRSGQAPAEFMSGSSLEVISKNYLGGGKAVLLANRGTATIRGTIAVSRFGVTGPASVRDVWAGTTHTMSSVAYRIQPAQTMLFVAKPVG
jgi:alpha-galactosidase